MPVTLNIFKKDKWENYEWDIYRNNLEILRIINKLKKQEFSDKIGIANAFRKDIGRPGRGTILEICNKFDVTENWLSTPRKVKEAVKEFKIKEKEKNYDPNGGWQPTDIEDLTGFPPDHEIWRAYKLLSKIYESRNRETINSVYKILELFSKNASIFENDD